MLPKYTVFYYEHSTPSHQYMKTDRNTSTVKLISIHTYHPEHSFFELMAGKTITIIAFSSLNKLEHAAEYLFLTMPDKTLRFFNYGLKFFNLLSL